MSEVLEILPAERLMRISRKITVIGGPLALGVLSLHFKDQQDAEEFLMALVEFRGKTKPEA